MGLTRSRRKSWAAYSSSRRTALTRRYASRPCTRLQHWAKKADGPSSLSPWTSIWRDEDLDGCLRRCWRSFYRTHLRRVGSHRGDVRSWPGTALCDWHTCLCPARLRSAARDPPSGLSWHCGSNVALLSASVTRGTAL